MEHREAAGAGAHWREVAQADVIGAGNSAFINLQQQFRIARHLGGAGQFMCGFAHFARQDAATARQLLIQRFAAQTETCFQKIRDALGHLLNCDRAHAALMSRELSRQLTRGWRANQRLWSGAALRDKLAGMLHYLTHPAAEGATLPRLLIVHGLFGSARNWNVIAKRLADRREVIAVDMRNHGQSPRFASQSYADMAQDLAEVIAHLGGPMDVLGHSMGGKAAMVLALSHPELVRRLVVADIAPLAYTHDNTHHIDAMRALDLADLHSRAEADRRLSAHIEDAGLRAFFLQSLDLKAQPPQWRLNHDVLAAEMPKIVGWPEVAGQFDGPVLFLSGGKSPYVGPDARAAIKPLFSKAYFAKLPEAGHWLHADNPREVEESVRIFLDAP